MMSSSQQWGDKWYVKWQSTALHISCSVMTEECIAINLVKVSTRGIKRDALLPVLRSLQLTQFLKHCLVHSCSSVPIVKKGKKQKEVNHLWWKAAQLAEGGELLPWSFPTACKKWAVGFKQVALILNVRPGLHSPLLIEMLVALFWEIFWFHFLLWYIRTGFQSGHLPLCINSSVDWISASSFPEAMNKTRGETQAHSRRYAAGLSMEWASAAAPRGQETKPHIHNGGREQD